MNKRHLKTLDAIFAPQPPANLAWRDVEALMIALGTDLSEGRGSRIRVALRGVRAVFHRPHPHKEMDKGAVVSLRRFLTEARIKP